jgi:NADPH2:quinone reductase
MKAMQVQNPGGAESMIYQEIPTPQPGPGEARVRLRAVGVNYIDVYHRIGLYPMTMPLTPGMEGAGEIDAVGPDVAEVRLGDRVAFAMHNGSYAEYAIVPAWKLVPLPAGISFEQGAALMLQGMTAHYLAHSTFPLGPGHRILLHAAAGGVGLLLVQIAKRLGATVIGTVGSEEKAALARQAGADSIILYTSEDFVTAVHRLTDGQGVHVVYDSVGKSTFDGSLKCLVQRGTMVSFGQSSGTIAPIDLGLLASRGSLFVTRPTLAHYTSTRTELLARSQALFNSVAAGELNLRIDSVYPLEEAPAAHRRLESRESSGKILLTP